MEKEDFRLRCIY